MLHLKEAKSRHDLKKFVKFPFTLYKSSKYWVPPIINQELEIFNKKINPTLEHVDIRLFLAYKNRTIVGRVAAIINKIEIENQGVRKMRFGWLDMIDDLEVTKLLVDKVKAIGLAHELKYMEGPVGFSNLDKVGVLSQGFDVIGTMVTWYNHPYYAKHFEALNFKIEKQYSEHKHAFEDINIGKSNRFETIIKKRYGLKALNFSKTSEVMVYADRMFDLFNESYANLSSFVKITAQQKSYMKNKFLSFINPEYIKFVVNSKDELVAFAIAMPSFASALQKIRGYLFPFGIFRILKAKRNKKINLFLIGIHPDYQNKGVHAIIFSEYHKTFSANGITEIRRTPELDDNEAINKIWRDFNPQLIKKRVTYRKEL